MDVPLLLTQEPGFLFLKLLKVLVKKGVSLENLTHVMVTLIHHDHTGGARWVLIQEFPNVVLVVHLRDAWHMIDQTKLTAETIDVYGEKHTRKHSGTIILVP